MKIEIPAGTLWMERDGVRCSEVFKFRDMVIETEENVAEAHPPAKPPYRCPTCGSSDPDRWTSCYHPACPDGRDRR